MIEALHRAELHIEGQDATPLRIAYFEVTEAISFLYQVRVIAHTPTLVEPESILAKKASIEIHPDNDDPPRTFHGLIFEASLFAVDASSERYELRLLIRPRLAQLEIGQNCRITQEMTVSDAVGLVLQEAELPEEMVEWSVNETYEEHPYITQFGESDYDYVSRLLAEEGISFIVVNELDEERVVFFDDDTAFEPLEAAESLSYPHQVNELNELHRAGSDKVCLRDYDFTKPSTDLTTDLDGEATTGREVYLHPGDFLETSRGDRLARVALERLQRDRRRIQGTSSIPSLAPGFTFSCVDHPRADMGVELVILRVVHRWHDGSYDNEFLSVPRETPVRPDLAAPAPVIGGIQVGFVTGASGAELHGSELGQSKVRFVWDRSGITDDTSSTWLRVGQFALPGSMVMPRVGFEVLVDYEMGDHDRPMVVGHLYNAEAMPPYPLPDEAGRSCSLQTNTTEGGGGANEMRFDDAAGAEELFMNASYDQTTAVENDAVVGIQANETVSIGANHSLKVTGSYNSSVGGARTLSVGGNQTLATTANYDDGTSGNLDVTVGSRKETCGGDLAEATTGSFDRTVGGLMAFTAIQGINRNIVGASTTKVGGAWLEVVAKDRNSDCGGTRTETIGALKLIKANTVSIACGAAYVQNCASETVKAGGSETITAKAAVGLQVGGSMSIDAANINISGETVVIAKIGGTKIEVLPAKVTIKSGTIKLTGVKHLQSAASHESS
ncbi:MAG: type VI secretion system tip protein VgrG [Myxococcales bacterium]|nr:type VI secretion system tip protein VgrG [Myxococcales bacterium]